MQTVSLSREFDAEPADVRALVEDVEAFTKAGGFDEVIVDGTRIKLTNGVGIATMELTLEIETNADAALAYRQVEGIFAEMETRYEIEETPTGSRLTGTTSFELDVGLVGGILDATVIKRQRRKEIDAQFDWVEESLA
jgi:hypothetical protein